MAVATIGQVFNFLTVVDHPIRRPTNSKHTPTRVFVRCKCICRMEKEYRLDQLESGNTKSCGCWNKIYQKTQPNARRHGKTGTSEYWTWCNIVKRCENVKNSHYHRYGERGIKMCDRWRNSIDAFLEDMGPKPSPLHTIERIDNSGNYEPGNCKWATRTEQTRNTAQNRNLTAKGKTQCLTDWARELGITPSGLSYRLKKSTIEEICS